MQFPRHVIGIDPGWRALGFFRAGPNGVSAWTAIDLATFGSCKTRNDRIVALESWVGTLAPIQRGTLVAIETQFSSSLVAIQHWLQGYFSALGCRVVPVNPRTCRRVWGLPMGDRASKKRATVEAMTAIAGLPECATAQYPDACDAMMVALTVPRLTAARRRSRRRKPPSAKPRGRRSTTPGRTRKTAAAARAPRQSTP